MQDSINNLKTNVDAINEDKTNNLKSENIRSGVTILGISGTLEEGIDTSDANATAEDIAINKTAYVNGEKVEGSIQVIENGYSKEIQLSETNNIPASNKFELTGTNKSSLILRNGAKVRIPISYNSVATAMKITSDKIKSGESIFGVEGNQSVVDTSDANATSDDIVQGKTAYVNGQKVTGSLPKRSFAMDVTDPDSIHIEENSIAIIGKDTITDEPYIYEPIDNNASVVVYDSVLAQALNLTQDKIVEGNTIAGVQGTASTILTEEFTKEQYAYMNGKTVVEYPDSLLLKSISMLDGSSITLTEAKLLSVVLLGDGITNESTKLDTVFTLAIKLNSSDLSKLSNKTFMLKAVFTPAEFDIGTININETSDIQYITVNTSIRLTSLLNEVDRYKIVEVDS